MAEPAHNPTMAYSRSKIPYIGALLDYVYTTLEYFRNRTFERGEALMVQPDHKSISTTFLTFACFFFGIASQVKFEVATIDDVPLPNDMHLVLLSKKDNLYVEDIDVSRVTWCLEASDSLVVLISCILIWNSSKVKSPVSEFLFLPWLGATLRGLMARQAPTVCAVLYTVATVSGTVDLLFLICFLFFYVLEARIWLEIARLIMLRWSLRGNKNVTSDVNDVSPSHTEEPSVEVGNFVY